VPVSSAAVGEPGSVLDNEAAEENEVVREGAARVGEAAGLDRIRVIVRAGAARSDGDVAVSVEVDRPDAGAPGVVAAGAAFAESNPDGLLTCEVDGAAGSGTVDAGLSEPPVRAEPTAADVVIGAAVAVLADVTGPIAWSLLSCGISR